jgi:hypothetical protein
MCLKIDEIVLQYFSVVTKFSSWRRVTELPLKLVIGGARLAVLFLVTVLGAVLSVL